MFKFVLNYNHNSRSAVPTGAGQAVENPVPEFHDAINYLLSTVPLFLEEVRKNDQSRSTIGETTVEDSSDPVPQDVTTDHTPHPSILEDPVDVVDIVPTEPSSLPVANVADRYTRSMLKCLLGYPLYNPKPFCEHSTEYLRQGVNVGDVGFVRGSGTFDFLFNICPSQNGLIINPPNLPHGFSLETPNHSATTTLEPLPQNTCLFQSPITKTKSGEYLCEDSEGAVLELPKGAIQDEAMNTRPFERLAARHGVQWYEYTMARGRGISNGSLYLITSVTKCSQWGIAVFDRPCIAGQGLKFDKKRSLPFRKPTSEYHWKGSHTFTTKCFNPDRGDAANQCVFVRGYKIMIRQDIFDNLCSDQPRKPDSAIPSSLPQAGTNMTRQPATRIRGGGGPNPVSRLTGTGLFSRTTTTKSDEEVVLHPNFSSSLVHPSDLFNAALLDQNPGAKVALTHDDVWCNLLRDNFPKLNHATLINTARLYTNTIEYDCVSLHKISDTSNVLEESRHPLQRTGTPALQGPVIQPDDDFAPVPVTPTISLTLPHELVERIILLLDTKSMLKCRLVNREFNGIIQSSTLVQYYLACKSTGVIDNPQSPLSYAERLEALKRREDAWRKLNPVFETTVRIIDHQALMSSKLTEGNYFLTYKNRKDLYYCRLPSSPQDNPTWFSIPGHGPGQSWSGSIVGTGIAVYEHDLVVNVISSEVGNEADMQRHSLDLVLLKFSTKEYHPLARHTLIHVQRSSSVQPYVNARIVGDNLALVVHDYRNGSELFIFDWKTGHKRLQHKAAEDAYLYSIPVFVSPELLLVPNRLLSHFEVWQLFHSHPNTTNPPIQILSLQLPAISTNHPIIHICCHGEFNPFLHSIPYFPPRPFSISSEDSIITVNLMLGREHLPGRCTFKLVMHRCALLGVIRKWASPSLLEQKEDIPTWLTNVVAVHKVADKDDGSVRLAAHSESVSTMRTRDSPTLATSQISPTSPTPHISAGPSSSSIDDGSASSTSRYNILQVRWADWGPLISRWFQVNGTYITWIPQSSGQRYVFLDPNPRDRTKYKIGVADFNLDNVRRNAELMARLEEGEGEHNASDGNNGKRRKEGNEEGLEILNHEGVFSEEVYMGLKCVVHHVPGEYDFDAVLMDEERLLGLTIDGSDGVESVEVLYIG